MPRGLRSLAVRKGVFICESRGFDSIYGTCAATTGDPVRREAVWGPEGQ
jgi:hypothetical protein